MLSGNQKTEHLLSLPVIFFATDPSDNIKEQIDSDSAWKFYSHTIKRDPKNLKLHVHRVFFAMQYKDATFLPSSLHDLFLVLDDAGEALRIRLLKASIPYLDDKDIVYFANWVKTQYKQNLVYKWLSGSVLSIGLFGPDQNLVTIEKSEHSEIHFTPLEEAKSCIEYGQLETAKEILEDALNENSEPQDKRKLEAELNALQRCIKQDEIVQSQPHIKQIEEARV